MLIRNKNITCFYSPLKAAAGSACGLRLRE
jgi:hypothetical protein